MQHHLFSAELVPFRRQLQKEAAWWGIGFHHIHAGWLSSLRRENAVEQFLGVFRANIFWQPWTLRNVTENCFACCVALRDTQAEAADGFPIYPFWSCAVSLRAWNFVFVQHRLHSTHGHEECHIRKSCFLEALMHQPASSLVLVDDRPWDIWDTWDTWDTLYDNNCG